MKDTLTPLIIDALSTLKNNGSLNPISDTELHAKIRFDHTKDKSHGDLATNIALMLAKPAGLNPRTLAQQIVDALPEHDSIEKVEVAGPGFINFFLKPASQYAVIKTILEQANDFGRSNVGAKQKIQIEFVSANPTGPLHVGHGRGAAYGASLANVMAAVGFKVSREYYVNDAGRQMNILAVSVWLRYLALTGEPVVFPSNGYQGDYVIDIARQLHKTHGEALRQPWATIVLDIPADEQPANENDAENTNGDKDAHIDALIEKAQALLNTDYDKVFNAGLDNILNDIKNDLQEFGADYDQWFSEKSLTTGGFIERALEKLDAAGYLFEQNGAIWFKSTAFGDDKDRVVKRDNGQTTYFASDIAYHMNKFERGFDQIINIWGSDHHGYIARVKAALQALGYNPDKLDIQLVQFAILYRGSERVQMSTRSGSFVTLRELRAEVGNDAARYFYVARKADQHMDFDLELAKSETKDNPVYYIQYAHARVCSMMRKLTESDSDWQNHIGLKNPQQLNLEPLTESPEQAIAQQLSRYPSLLEKAAMNHEPHIIAHYLKELAGNFHAYYNAHKVLVEDPQLRNARIALCMAVKQVIANGLQLLGVSAPETM